MSPDDLDTGDDDLLGRLAGGTHGITPLPEAVGVVRGAVRRRRRLRAAQGVAGAAAVVVAVGGTLVAVSGLGHGSTAPGPAASSSAVVGGRYRPVGFFEDVVGGRAIPIITRHHKVPHEPFYARFEWTPPDGSGSYLADLALEKYRGSAAAACARLPFAGVTCTPGTGDQAGAVIARYQIPANDGFFDPVHRASPIRLRVQPGAATPEVLGTTYFRSRRTAVSVLVCNCSGDHGGVLADAPPITADQELAVVGDDTWADVEPGN